MSTIRWAMMGWLLLATGAAQGQTFAVDARVSLIGDLRITGPTLAFDGAAPDHAVASFELVNRGPAPDRLLSAEVENAQVLAMTADGASGGDGSTLLLPPGQPLRVRLTVARDGAASPAPHVGELMPGTLRFDRAGPLPVTFRVTEPTTAAAPAQ